MRIIATIGIKLTVYVFFPYGESRLYWYPFKICINGHIASSEYTVSLIPIIAIILIGYNITTQ